MSARPSRQSQSSCHSAAMPNPDVFSDEYAVDVVPPSTSSTSSTSPTSPTLSPFRDDANARPPSSFDSSQPTTQSTRSTSIDYTASGRNHATNYSPSLSDSSSSSREASASFPSWRNFAQSNSRTGSRRVSTTSSLSLAPAQSPYVGPTTSSHPYGMYPQATRASSLTSASTIRPSERSFINASAPGHPYAMYSQNTVPEEADDVRPRIDIPLGFPGVRSGGYREDAPGRSNDIADIVGSDGHVEQLPPYTPFAQNDPAAKANAARVRSLAAPAELSSSETLTAQPLHSLGRSEVEEAAPNGGDPSDASGSFKEKVKKTSRRTVCGGVPLWFLVAIVVVLLLGVIIGAVIGVKVGRDGASDGGRTGDDQEAVSDLATVSDGFLDALPVPSDQPLAPIPRGEFSLGLADKGVGSSGCIEEGGPSIAWSCVEPPVLDFEISGRGGDAQIFLDSDRLPLTPATDRNLEELGPAFSAWTLHDKLTIVRDEDLLPSEKTKRDDDDGKDGEVGDDDLAVEEKPWYCYFNRTVVEVFIYVDQDLEDPDLEDQDLEDPDLQDPDLEDQDLEDQDLENQDLEDQDLEDQDLEDPSSAVIDWHHDDDFLGPYAMDPARGPPRPRPNPDRKPFRPGSQDGPPPPFEDEELRRPPVLEHDSRRRSRRSERPAYPRLMKIEEKRLPLEHPEYVAPYCRQMQVLASGRIVEAEPGREITIPELDQASARGPRLRNRSLRRIVRRDEEGGEGEEDDDEDEIDGYDDEDDEDMDEEPSVFFDGSGPAPSPGRENQDRNQNPPEACACEWMNG